jgi:hypothetical protein
MYIGVGTRANRPPVCVLCRSFLPAANCIDRPCLFVDGIAQHDSLIRQSGRTPLGVPIELELIFEVSA